MYVCFLQMSVYSKLYFVSPSPIFVSNSKRFVPPTLAHRWQMTGPRHSLLIALNWPKLTLGQIVPPLSPVSNDLKTAVTHSSSLSVSMSGGLAIVLDTFRSLLPDLFVFNFSSCSLISCVIASYSLCRKVVIFRGTGRVLGLKVLYDLAWHTT